MILSAAAAAAESDDYALRLTRAEALLVQERASEALPVFEDLIAQKAGVQVCVGAAHASALMDRPDDALRYFRQALLFSQSAAELRVARFGIGRMLMWQEEYSAAERIYRELLSSSLPPEDHALASAGLLRSLCFQNKPRLAYSAAQAGNMSSPAEKIELGRAALWAGWPDKAAGIVNEEIPVEPGTRMARELDTLRSDISAELADPLNLHAAFISDSDDLRVRKSEFGAGKRFSSQALNFLLQHQGFEQYDRQISMNSVQGRYSGQIGDELSLLIQAGPAEYDEWHTVLWSGRAGYRPNDDIGYEIFIGKEVVETIIGLEHHTSMENLGFTAAYRPVHAVSLTGSVNRQTFSDENRRLAGGGLIKLLLSERAGANVGLKARYFSDSRTDTTGYFNPARFHEEQLLFILDRRIAADWSVHVLAGSGRQRVSPGERTTTSLLELSVESRIFKPLSINLDFGYSNSATASSSGYRRQYSGLTFSYSW